MVAKIRRELADILEKEGIQHISQEKRHNIINYVENRTYVKSPNMWKENTQVSLQEVYLKKKQKNRISIKRLPKVYI